MTLTHSKLPFPVHSGVSWFDRVGVSFMMGDDSHYAADFVIKGPRFNCDKSASWPDYDVIKAEDTMLCCEGNSAVMFPYEPDGGLYEADPGCYQISAIVDTGVGGLVELTPVGVTVESITC